MTTLANNTNPLWLKDPGMRGLNFLLLAYYLGAMGDAYTSTLISNLIANPRYLHDIKGLSDVRILGLVVAAHALGALAAFLPAPWLSERYGRRAGILAGNIGKMAGFTGQVVSSTFDQFLGLRLFVGFSSLFSTISSSALVIELAHPRQRPIAGALFNTCYFVGSITAAWTSYEAMKMQSAWSWRLPVAVQLCWSVAQLALRAFCPESPTWLLRHGREQEAKATTVRYYANGQEDDELVCSEMARMRASADQERQAAVTGWLALVSTPGNRKRLVLSIAIAIATQWVGNGIVSHYLTLGPILDHGLARRRPRRHCLSLPLHQRLRRRPHARPHSLRQRHLALPPPHKGHQRLLGHAVRRAVRQPVCQSHCAEQHRLEVLSRLCRRPGRRAHLHLLLRARDKGPVDGAGGRRV